MARLNPCPFKKASFSASCEAVPLQESEFFRSRYFPCRIAFFRSLFSR